MNLPRLHTMLSTRRNAIGTLLTTGAGLIAPRVFAQRLTSNASSSRDLREMQIRKVPELGLEIWVENQPAWEENLTEDQGRPIFTTQSPDDYHPPTAMTFSAWPKERVPDAQMPTLALTAIRGAAMNFGLNAAQARSIAVLPAQHGALQGAEGDFAGFAQGVDMDVKVFVGQQSGHYPVALSIYTLKGKMPHLAEVVRRCWGNLTYLS
jgi:hypothetical protein